MPRFDVTPWHTEAPPATTTSTGKNRRHQHRQRPQQPTTSSTPPGPPVYTWTPSTALIDEPTPVMMRTHPFRNKMNHESDFQSIERTCFENPAVPVLLPSLVSTVASTATTRMDSYFVREDALVKSSGSQQQPNSAANVHHPPSPTFSSFSSTSSASYSSSSTSPLSLTLLTTPTPVLKKKKRRKAAKDFWMNNLPWCQICGGLCAFLLALQVVVIACGLFVWPTNPSTLPSTPSELASSSIPGVLRRVGSDENSVMIMVAGEGKSNGVVTKKNVDFLERHGVTYRNKAQNICSQDPIYFVIAVHSHPKSFMRRNTIRNTWGSVKRIDDWNIRLVFVLGESQGDEKLDLLVQSEAAIFDDLVQGEFEDSYRNLTVKHLLTYKWASTYCKNAKFLLKTDEDVFVDVYQLFHYIQRNLGSDPSRTVACSVNPAGMPVQRGAGKWSVTKEEYSPDVYPTYCAGLSYLITTDVLRDVYNAANRVRFFWIDDVYVTGLLPMASGVPGTSRVSMNLRFTMDRRQLAHWLKKAPAGVPPPYFVTHVDLDDKSWNNFVYAAWRKLTRNHPS